MEPNEKSKLDIKRVLITAVIVLAAAGVVGGTTWYVMDKSAKEIKTANDQSMAALQKQIGEQKTAASSTTATPTPAKVNTYTDEIGRYTITVPDGYIMSVVSSREGGPVSTITLNKKLNDVSYAVYQFTINAYSAGQPANLDQWNKETQFLDNETLTVTGTQKLGGVTATKYTGGGFFGETTDYRLVRNGTGYGIHFVNDSVDSAVVNTIVSSFKFN